MKFWNLFAQVYINQQKLTTMPVRHLKVSEALYLLKLNQVDYYDCEILEENLASYLEDGLSVVVGYYLLNSNKNPEWTYLSIMVGNSMLRPSVSSSHSNHLKATVGLSSPGIILSRSQIAESTKSAFSRSEISERLYLQV